MLGLVHRIDRPCSGVVVFAKTSKAAARLSESFRLRKVVKEYLCIVNGQLEGLILMSFRAYFYLPMPQWCTFGEYEHSD
jgi:23S rRNA-/tRNA-specific pseudouridylate synthase